MSNLLSHKGYVGRVEFDAEGGVLWGTVAGIGDVIHFQGDTAAEVVRAFRESVDDYLDFCAELGRRPEEAKSGELRVRVGPELHSGVEAAANAAGVSVDDWVLRQLKRGVAEEAVAGRIGTTGTSTARRRSG